MDSNTQSGQKTQATSASGDSPAGSCCSPPAQARHKFRPGKAKRPEHQDQKEHRQKHLVTQLYKSLRIVYKSQHEAMTDYSAAIYGLIAFASVITAGVVYVLAQPTDVPVAQKTRS